jgi:hypothetical protein
MATKKKTVAGVTIAPKRKGKANSASFKKGAPNPHAFQPGESGNIGGKPKLIDAHLSRSLRIVLADRAPDAVCVAAGLPTHSTWSMCLARRLVYMAIKGDLSAWREIRESTEGSRLSADLSFHDGGEAPPVLQVVFVPSDGDGHPAPGQTIDSQTVLAPVPVLPAKV